jgi:drug/metabolite transporter (DMT)-like permease
MPLQNNPLKGIALMNLAMLLLACMDGLSKHLAANYAVPQILCVRFLIFCLFALAIARPPSLRAAFRSHHPYLQIARSLVITVEVAVFVLAFRYLPLADTHAIAGIAPLLVTALAMPFLGERVGPRRWTAVAIGFLGLLIIVRPGLTVLNPAAAIPLLGAALWAAYQILMRKVSDDDAATSLLYMAVVGALVMSILAPFYWRPPDAQGWALMILLGLTGSLGHLILIMAFRAVPLRGADLGHHGRLSGLRRSARYLDHPRRPGHRRQRHLRLLPRTTGQTGAGRAGGITGKAAFVKGCRTSAEARWQPRAGSAGVRQPLTKAVASTFLAASGR